MPKTYEEYYRDYDKTKETLTTGHNHVFELFTVGLTVQNPLNGNQPVTFNSAQDAKELLQDLNSSKDPAFPLCETGRPGNEYNHMKLFLYSKGFTPQDIIELTTNPGSDRSKQLGDQIKGFRKEYFDMITLNADFPGKDQIQDEGQRREQARQKSIENIGQMYASAFQNLNGVSLDWLKNSNTPEKLLDNLPMIDALSGSMSFYTQTNRMGTDMRPVDRDVMESIHRESRKVGVNVPKTADALQTIDMVQQYYDRAVGPTKRDRYSSRMLAGITAQFCGSLPDNTTIGELGSDSAIGMEPLIAANYSHYNEPEDEGYINSDLGENFDAWFQGEPDAIPPCQIIDTRDSGKLISRHKWSNRSDEEDPLPIEENPAGWKAEKENEYRSNLLMDSPSVVHCISLAKKGEYDAIAGKRGEGQRMLDVMNGNYAGFDKLTDLSKSAVAGRLVMEHPELFCHSAADMKKAAGKLGMSLDNPVYVAAMDKLAGVAEISTIQRHLEVKRSLAADRLENGLQNASPDQKKMMAKNLFLMQIGDAEQAGLANDRNQKAKMLETLAAGGTVKFNMPAMTSAEKDALKRSIPEGRREIAEGIRQNSSYGSDNTLSVNVQGAMGVSAPQGGMEVDLRGITPKNLNTMLANLDEKMASMNPNELDALINQLKGGSMEKNQAAEMVQTLGLNADGTEKANRPQIDLAAKEVNPEPVLGQNDLNAIERGYSMQLGEQRKYKAPEPLDTTSFEKTLNETVVPQHKEYFTKYLAHYNEQVRQMQMYADAAERMHNVRTINENSPEPLGNVRTFAQTKEKELAEKYRAAKENVDRMAAGINAYSLNGVNKKNDKEREAAWIKNYFDKPALTNDINENYNKKGPSKEQLDATLAGNFTAIEMENSTFREQQNLKDNTWTLMGVKYSNSDKYQNILDSMDKLKQMRGMDATKENMDAYQKEYEHLRDLCEDYIVTRKNPWTQDGKDRKRMVTDVWEGMSNVNAQSFEAAKNSIQPGQKIGDMNIHVGYRRQVSLSELQNREHAAARNQRLADSKREKAEEWRRQREAAKQNQRAARQQGPQGPSSHN